MGLLSHRGSMHCTYLRKTSILDGRLVDSHVDPNSELLPN